MNKTPSIIVYTLNWCNTQKKIHRLSNVTRFMADTFKDTQPEYIFKIHFFKSHMHNLNEDINFRFWILESMLNSSMDVLQERFSLIIQIQHDLWVVWYKTSNILSLQINMIEISIRIAYYKLFFPWRSSYIRCVLFLPIGITWTLYLIITNLKNWLFF